MRLRTARKGPYRQSAYASAKPGETLTTLTGLPVRPTFVEMSDSRRTIRVSLALAWAAACITLAHAAPTEDLGRSVARTLQEGDGPGFAALLDTDRVLDRALEGMEGGEEFLTGVRTALERSLSQVGTVMVKTLGPGAKLSYLRTRIVQGTPRALVRVDLGDRGLNYVDFFLREHEDGSWRVFDWHDYVQGQTYTDSLRMALALLVKDKPSLVSRLLGMPDLDGTSVKQFVKMGKLGQQGDWAGWLEVYGSLPARVRDSRVLLVNRVVAAGAVGNQDEYVRAMSDLLASQGDDPTLSLALVDYFLLTGDYARAYQAVDRLDEYTGGDAALTNLRSGISLYEGDNPASVRYAREAIALDADYEDPYWNLLVAGSRAGDFKAGMEGVRGLETRFGLRLSEDQIRQSEDLSRLAASEEWRSARAGGSPTPAARNGR